MTKIGITLGDPAGIGPEIIRAAIGSGQIDPDVELHVIGDASGFVAGEPSDASARAAVEGLEEAARRLATGAITGVVTGPISKKRLHDVGWNFPGQTEFFAQRAGVENFAMCLTGGRLTVALVTAHIPLRDIADLLTSEEIVRVGCLLCDFLCSRGIDIPRIAVAGLNPHAGEGGDLGSEEIEIIAPAIAALSQTARGAFVGPVSPDTVFHRAANGEFDGVLCMYHDQGLIPLKLLAFDEGVNVTLGLPFVRTSPDHGTAFEIAGKSLARPESMLAAINLAASLAKRRALPYS